MSKVNIKYSGFAVLFVLFSISITLKAADQQPSLQSTEASPFVQQLLARMTIEEKLGQVTQYAWPGDKATQDQFKTFVRQGAVGSFLNIAGVAKLSELQKMAVEETRLGIPLLFAMDVIHGWRTVFPVPLAEASSWNLRGIRKSARIAAEEASAQGIHWTFAPMVDIARDPRWGRIVEGSGEDPYLGSEIARARVHGFQSNDLTAPNTLAACAKHFVAYGAAEGGRDYNIADISVPTLREIYLPPFKAAVEANVQTVMAAFNELAGIPMHAHPKMLGGVLKQEWCFKGFVVSDYTGVMELLRHGVAGDTLEAAEKALSAGIDMEMVSGFFYRSLADVISEQPELARRLDKAVERILTLKMKLGLFDKPFRYLDRQREQNALLTAEARQHARQIARESIVLLKNNKDVLPIDYNPETIAVIGALADDQRAPLGSWAGAGRSEDVVSVLQGIKQAFEPQTTVLYQPAYRLDDFSLSEQMNEIAAVARDADLVFLVIGERGDMSGEAAARANIELPGEQMRLANAVIETGKPVVAILMNGRPLAIPRIVEQVPAILECWFLGVEMGNAVADVITGEYNPSAKLPVTFPRHTGQIPIYYNHKNTGRPPDKDEKYTSKYIDIDWKPAYPFGHGLSYTTFKLTDVTIQEKTLSKNDSIRIHGFIENTGATAGAEVVQLYFRDPVAGMTRPVKQLIRFKRIVLEAGERQSFSFSLAGNELTYWNSKYGWRFEPGYFKFFIGTSSVDCHEITRFISEE